MESAAFQNESESKDSPKSEAPDQSTKSMESTKTTVSPKPKDTAKPEETTKSLKPSKSPKSAKSVKSGSVKAPKASKVTKSRESPNSSKSRKAPKTKKVPKSLSSEPSTSDNVRLKAVATESEWMGFLDDRYNEDDERKTDWKPPEILTFWEQGPIGIVKEWWDDTATSRGGAGKKGILDDGQESAAMLPSKEEISRRKQNRTIKRDIMKELKQQKLEQRLRARLEKGELVQQSADNALDSFFTAALEMGQDIRSGKLQQFDDDEEAPKERKTKIVRPQERALKAIASLKDDELFFFDDSDPDDGPSDAKGSVHAVDGESGGVEMDRVNENDMIHIEANSIGNARNGHSQSAVIAAKMSSERLLLEQRVREQHEAMKVDLDALEAAEQDVKRRLIKKDGVVSSRILSGTYEDALREKKVLKRLNVMDYVRNYKNAFFREVEELDLNVDALLQNWQSIKTHDGISRKLRKKLGIVMARERAKRKKKEAQKERMQKMIEEMTKSEDESDDSETDVSAGVDSFVCSERMSDSTESPLDDA